jgi:TPR repeat protein
MLGVKRSRVTQLPVDVSVLRASLQARALPTVCVGSLKGVGLRLFDPSLQVHDLLTSYAGAVHTSLSDLAASTELLHQQIDQHRAMQHTAVDACADSLHETAVTESACRTQILERQSLDISLARETLDREQAAVREALESHTDDQLRLVGNDFSQRLDAAFESVGSIRRVYVAPEIRAQFNHASVLSAIANSGVVYGAQSASLIYDQAFALLIGRGDVKPDAAAAFAAFCEAADKGNTTAMGYAACQLHAGFGVAKDETRAKQLFVDAARNGDLYSRAMVIMLNERTDEYEYAFSLFEQVARKGHVAAEYDMGNCLFEGFGCSENYQNAADCFRRSADQGYAIAQSALATCFTDGTGVAKDPAAAVEFYRLAANQGFTEAQNYLGVCYHNGTGIPQDPAQAVFWYKLAAEKGSSDAQCNLGICCVDGTGVEQDPVQAVVWYRRSADQGNSTAQFALGDCYAHGRSVDKDPVQAVVWFTLAAQQGDANAQSTLGKCFFDGVGVDKDYIQAVNFFMLAAKQGHAAAHYNLGVCHLTGKGATKCLLTAITCYKRAAELGHSAAIERLAMIDVVALPIWF